MVWPDAGRGGDRLIPAAEHERVLARGVDVPEERPAVPLPIGEVGISGKTVWLRSGGLTLPMRAELCVDLPAERRGIHMSRMEEVVSRLYREDFPSPAAYAAALAAGVLAGQEGGRAEARIAGGMPLLRPAAVSGRDSLDTVEVDCRAVALRRGGDVAVTETGLGVTVTHITACPCTQAYNLELCGRNGGLMPMPTHSQRSRTTLRLLVRGAEPPGVDELVACLDRALHLTSDLLKRPDEAEIVMASHRRPQFAEDAVRETARSAWEAFGGVLPPETGVEIESLSLESIHIHDVRCRMETSLAGIGDLLHG
jgi:GTP cyclohydrolase FolE2